MLSDEQPPVFPAPGDRRLSAPTPRHPHTCGIHSHTETMLQVKWNIKRAFPKEQLSILAILKSYFQDFFVFCACAWKVKNPQVTPWMVEMGIDGWRCVKRLDYSMAPCLSFCKALNLEQSKSTWYVTGKRDAALSWKLKMHIFPVKLERGLWGG